MGASSVEKNRLGFISNRSAGLVASLSLIFFFLVSCSSTFLTVKDADKLNVNEEFAQAIQISTGPAITTEATKKNPDVLVPFQTEVAKTKNKKVAAQGTGKNAALDKSAATASSQSATKPSVGKKAKAVKSTTTVESSNEKSAVAEAVLPHLPEIENGVGFNGRRPINDPYRVGEVVTHSIRYFKVDAGEIKFKVEPFAQVNGVKAYTFALEIESAPLFSSFYSVKDRAETWVGYDDLVPRAYQLHVKESGQLREAKSAFNVEKNEATFWEKKVTKKSGEETKKQNWSILPYSQNVFSALFYLRAFNWEVGKEYAYRVAHDEENLVFTGKALRKETIDTPLGPKKAIVIQPSVTLKGAFKPLGNVFFWLSDDEHKYLLRMELEIKIGTLVSEVVSIEPGGDK